MSVCIAAMSASEEVIVSVTDTRLSKGHYSTEYGLVKIERLHDDWSVLFAGTISQRNPITSDVMSRVAMDQHAPLRLTAVQDAFIGAYQTAGKRLAEEAVLSPYGMNMEQFLNSRQQLGDVLFEKTWDAIKRTRVGCEFLVCGFDTAGGMHIFSVSNPTEDNPSFITDYDEPGFAAIGSGSYLAESILYSVGQHVFTSDLETTIYNLCAAKFAAEGASDVGDWTFVRAMKKGRKQVTLTRVTGDQIKKIWEKNKPKIPRKGIELISKHLTQFRATTKPEAKSSITQSVSQT